MSYAQTLNYGDYPYIESTTVLSDEHFTSNKSLQVKYSLASKRFMVICRLFSNKCQSKESREAYLSAFGIDAWKALEPEEREEHTLSECKACQEHYPQLVNVFPTPAKRVRKPVVTVESHSIKFTEKDLSSTKAIGRRMLKDFDDITQQRFQKSVQEVLAEAPGCNLIQKPTKAHCTQQRKNIKKEVRDTIQKHKEESTSELVLQNRISWGTYDKIRKAEALQSTKKRSAQTTPMGEPNPKRRHGVVSSSLQINTERLLTEAASWPPNKQVNWSSLAREYCLEASNGGQIIKEFLQEHDVPAANMLQRPSRAERRCKR